ncbi:RING/U-box superfamily protein [Thalictrum thalictroides]|uniref:RING/U-box superfamily protein n=1 Tax=Thalictrum thalictroides TaxID=46969 RepID=A0A7J6VC59_THATH|nr:RING/U-box superfamily protein [Thalictrum thalictroides]
MGPHEPYWRTNTSFSPPLSRRWERRLQTDGIQYASQSGLQLYESSPSPNSKESGPSMRDDHLPNHIASDGAGSFFSSPSDSFQTQQWTPSPMKEVNIDDYVSGTLREPASGPLMLTSSMEGTSVAPYNAGSISSRSDSSEYEAVFKTHAASNRNFSTRCSFMSKPIHPISFVNQTPDRDVSGTLATGNSLNRQTHNEAGSSTPRRETLRWSSASSMDFTDVSEQLDSDSGISSYNLPEGFKCGMCDRFLSQTSPWSSRRIVRSGDMPVTGVLSCRHVFHADCLEQSTPKMQKHDPPCPVCARLENTLEQPTSSRLKNVPPRLSQVGEDGPSRPWSCGQVGDCVEGALHASPRNSMMMLNRSRLKKHLSFKGSSSKDLPEKSKKKSSQCHGKSVEPESFEFSKLTAGPTLLKR